MDFSTAFIRFLSEKTGKEYGDLTVSVGHDSRISADRIRDAVISVVVAMLPTSAFGIDGLTDVHQRIIALFVFAALMWLTEAMPSWVTSMVVVTVMLFTVSTSAFNFLRPEGNAGLVPFKSIMACFSNPTIMLFIGGFVLAIGLTKVKLDVALARVLLKPFGTRSEVVLLGFILVTAIFSAFVSNTATAAMMLAFLTPVLKSLPADGKGRIALQIHDGGGIKVCWKNLKLTTL